MINSNNIHTWQRKLWRTQKHKINNYNSNNQKCPQWNSCIHNTCFSPVPKQEHLWFNYGSSYQTIKEGCCREARYGVAGPDRARHPSAPSAHRHNSAMWRSAISSLLTIALWQITEGLCRKEPFDDQNSPFSSSRLPYARIWGLWMCSHEEFVRKRVSPSQRCQMTAECK